MIELLSVVILALAIVVAVLNAVFATEVIAGLTASAAPAAANSCMHMVIVVPANDEATIIGEHLASLKRCLGPGDRILVVADNCSDDTAAIAEAQGVEVVVREDRSAIGKGHALAAARDYLRASPPDVVVILDADCLIDRPGLLRLAAGASWQSRPIQGISLLCPDLSAPPLVQVSTFAFAVRNRLRNVGLFRITDCALLNGTGMAFPWPAYACAPLATSSQVEDLELGLKLAALGFPAAIDTGVVIWSRASNARGTLLQRKRWEGGFLATASCYAVPTLAGGIRGGDFRRIWRGLDLLVPPLSLLAMLNLVAAAVAAIALVVGVSSLPLVIVAGVCGAMTLATGAAWLGIGRPFLSARAALLIPFYVAWKVPIYLSLARRSSGGWLRTGR